MHARAVTIQMQVGKLDEAISVFDPSCVRRPADKLGAKFGLGRCGGIEKTCSISLTSEERWTRPQMALAYCHP
jgi:hypothetical protein